MRLSLLTVAVDLVPRRDFSPLALLDLLCIPAVVLIGETKAVNVHTLTTGVFVRGQGSLGAGRLLVAAGKTPVPEVAARGAFVVWTWVGGIEQSPRGIVVNFAALWANAAASLDEGGEEEEETEEGG